MLSSSTFLRRLPLRLIALGGVVLVAGVAMQVLGVAPPAMLKGLVGADTAFGVMARIGGLICLPGLVLAGFGSAVDRPEQPEPNDEPKHDLALAVTPEYMAQWQRRLAEKAAASALVEPVRPRRIGANLHRGAIIMVAVALGGLLAASIWGNNRADVTSVAQAVPEASAPS